MGSFFSQRSALSSPLDCWLGTPLFALSSPLHCSDNRSSSATAESAMAIPLSGDSRPRRDQTTDIRIRNAKTQRRQAGPGAYSDSHPFAAMSGNQAQFFRQGPMLDRHDAVEIRVLRAKPRRRICFFPLGVTAEGPLQLGSARNSRLHKLGRVLFFPAPIVPYPSTARHVSRTIKMKPTLFPQEMSK
jgi:hypothetical protein